MYAKHITRDSEYLEEIHQLYEQSFPKDEKMKWQQLISSLSDSRLLTAYFTDEHALAGFTYVFNERPAAYLSYFAVEPALRAHGYGSEILHLLTKELSPKKIIIDIEELNDQAENAEERRKRRDFYLHNGFIPTGIFYHIWHVDYELLSINGKAIRSDWEEITQNVWGIFAKRIVYKEGSL